ncbi:hypothetical protein BXZ70DRAFT_1009229 [Cristinia sonorae]|uniref:F-box domain-containing protein n=1 Tax=Cristinia sonorae TaxID=1940300 RepID=A0A8K0XNV9_9AGAR|nr:hypothetical protein BXZ70DRAFT_1009229 [Cristinia sonorae]
MSMEQVSSTSTYSPRIPVEIYETIIDILALADIPSLKNCHLASRLFVPRCRSHIFRSIHLSSRDTPHRHSGEDLYTLLSASPDIAFHIRELKINVFYHTDFLSRGLLEASKMLDRLEVLWVGSNLRPKHRHDTDEALLHWDALYLIQPTIYRLLQVPTLRELHVMMSIQGFPVSWLRNSCIKSLTLDWSGLEDDELDTMTPCSSSLLECVTINHRFHAGSYSLLTLVHPKGSDGQLQPVIDASRLKVISIPVYPPLMFNAALPLFQGGNLTSVILRKIDSPSDMPSLRDYLAPSLHSLRRLRLEVSIDDVMPDSGTTMVQILSYELATLCGENHIETLELDVKIKTDRTFDIPTEWEDIDGVLAGSGWPMLRRVVVSICPNRIRLEEDCEFYLALQSLPTSHLMRLMTSSRTIFDFSFELHVL